GAVHAFRAFGQHERRAVRDQQLAALDAHRLGHRQRERDAARASHERKRDARVSARRLDDRLARSEQSPLFCVPNHRRAETTLHRIRGIAAFDLRQHGRLRAIDDTIEADKRRAPNRQRVVLEPVGHRVLRLRYERRAPRRAPYAAGYCCAFEHSTFISLQTRSTLSDTRAAAFGCWPLCADDMRRCERLSPSALTLIPAICWPFVNWTSPCAASSLVILRSFRFPRPRITAANTLSDGASSITAAESELAPVLSCCCDIRPS